ncbi:MAG: hypothetical protein QOH85_1070 [Acidobacteriaceae bacterium]|jgi:hypothetical protein|nr:hypothetical protein [Acidobacteriaceae bacterium]
MAANTSGNYGSNRGDFGVSNNGELTESLDFARLQIITRIISFAWFTSRFRGKLNTSRPVPGLLDAG